MARITVHRRLTRAYFPAFFASSLFLCARLVLLSSLAKPDLTPIVKFKVRRRVDCFGMARVFILGCARVHLRKVSTVARDSPRSCAKRSDEVLLVA